MSCGTELSQGSLNEKIHTKIPRVVIWVKLCFASLLDVTGNRNGNIGGLVISLFGGFGVCCDVRRKQNDERDDMAQPHHVQETVVEEWL